MQRKLTVSQLNKYISGVFDDELVLHDVTVCGEVYEFRRYGARTFMMLREGDFSEIETVLTMRDQLFESIAEAIKSELTRINEARSNTKASMLYLTILTETKNMVLQSRNLLKSQQYFLKHLTGPKTWIK